jgi:EAL domain-containing protein (putative c-di-GMP-specific phosphodiesterase class I)
LSPIQFSSSNLVDRVACILAESGLSPKCLEFEITERVFMDDSEHTLSTLHQLKKIGVRIALDDFGTGYSSLSYLRRFPFDKIKIDRSFVSDLSQRTEHAPIIQAVVNIAAALGMETTAEGIETKDQQEFLTALGCNEGQGYYLGKPMPIESHADIISERAIKEILAA